MASNVTRDHHSLRRNLKLNGNYISNDGGDEGITITDAGAVAISSTIELGHATDTTLTRASSGDVNIEGNAIYRAGGTDVAVLDGGTGASSLNDLITMGTHTTGNYVATITGGSGITSSGATSGEDIAHSLSLTAGLIADGSNITSVGTLTGLAMVSTATTANVLDIQATALTYGSALLLNVDDSLTATATKNLVYIDYDKSGVTASGQLSATTGLLINMADAATNDASGSAVMVGANISLTSANAQGNIVKTGLILNVADNDVGDATTIGIDMEIMDGGTDIKIKSSANTADYCTITTTTNGATTITTIDASDEEADLTLNIDGFIDMNSASGEDITLDSGGVITLDPATITEGNGIQFFMNGTHVGNITGHHTSTNLRLYENIGASTDDYFNIAIGASGETTIKTVDAGGTGGNIIFQPDGHVDFESAVGFTHVTEAFSDDSIIGSGATDDTHIDFRVTNKVLLAVTGNITNLNLIFPAVSGNFLLLLSYDGDHTITNYKVYEADESAADGDADVFWPGGNKPDNTSSGVDILSFFYDASASAEKCYGVASLAFATP